jgi:hypothetical protein
MKHAFSAGRQGGRALIEHIEHVMILGVLFAACIVAVIHGMEKGSSFAMKVVFAVVLVAAVGMEFRAVKKMVISWYRRQTGSAVAWCALWLICAISTLYVSFGTAASNINKVAVLHKASFNAFTDTRSDLSRAQATVDRESANVERLRSESSFKTLINGVEVTTIEAANGLVKRAKSDPMWKSTDECREVKGPKTRAFCDSYRAADAAIATIGRATERATELKAAEIALEKARADLAAAKGKADHTSTEVSDEAPHISVLAHLAGWTPEQARVADGMQLPILMQALLSLAALVLAIDMMRGEKRPPSKLRAWVKRMWNGAEPGSDAQQSSAVVSSPTPVAVEDYAALARKALAHGAPWGHVYGTSRS